MLAAIQFPSWLRPEIIPGLPFRWYGLMYVVAFGVTWLLFRRESVRRAAPWDEDRAYGSFFWAIAGLIIGARIFGTLVYDPTGYYRSKPWLVFSPFDESGRFAGFQGMSYHGGFVGVIVATLIYCKIKGMSWLAWADVIAVSAPLGYTAGRLGNFINGELWGKVTASPLGMIFPGVPEAGRFSAGEAWVQDMAARVGIQLRSMNDVVNLPRHPSQLYEAAFEGVVLWLVMWLVVRRIKAFPGFATGIYAIGYGAARFVIEYFREPDAGIGYVLGDKSAPTYLYTGPWNISTGQIFCAAMIAGGLVFLFAAKALHGRRASPAPSAGGEAGARAAAREARGGAGAARKLRKRIK